MLPASQLRGTRAVTRKTRRYFPAVSITDRQAPRDTVPLVPSSTTRLRGSFEPKLRTMPGAVLNCRPTLACTRNPCELIHGVTLTMRESPTASRPRGPAAFGTLAATLTCSTATTGCSADWSTGAATEVAAGSGEAGDRTVIGEGLAGHEQSTGQEGPGQDHPEAYATFTSGHAVQSASCDTRSKGGEIPQYQGDVQYSSRAATEESPMKSETLVKQLRNPASAAVAGIIFSVILIVVLVQFHGSVPAGRPSTDWLNDESRRQGVKTAVSLIPFAGIAFLWFIGVIRTRLGDREDKLFATVFLGSGLLFVALLFLAGALLTTVLTLFERGIPVGADSLLLLVVFTKSLMGMFGARMAAVFTISVSSIGMRTKILPKWLVVLGYLTGVILLLSPPLSNWTQLLFPTWVLLFSLYILVASRHLSADA